MLIAPSILACDLADVRGALEAARLAGCELVHFDIMDGHFVPNLSFGPPLVRSARPHSSLDFDVHLMVTDPAAYIEPLAGLGLKLLSFQIEATNFAPRLISRIRQAGFGAGVVLNPQTPISAISEILHLVDNVLLMSVDPGYGGQSFIGRSWDKIAQLAEARQRGAHAFTIQIDGGAGADNLERLRDSGVDIAVMGSAFYGVSAEQQAQLVRLALGGGGSAAG